MLLFLPEVASGRCGSKAILCAVRYAGLWQSLLETSNIVQENFYAPHHGSTIAFAGHIF